MKKFYNIFAVCAAVSVLAVSCCGGKQKVCAVVAGPDKVAAVVIEYPEAIDAESVCPEAYVVDGEEVVCTKLVDGNKVIVALKKDCCGKHEGCEKKACDEAKPECDKPACDKKAECGKPCHKKPECCKEGAQCCVEGAECCKPACDKKAECGDKPACDKKAECDKPCPKDADKKPCCKEKCDIPVPDVSVKQVVDIKTAEGKVVKAWKKAVKASEAVPAHKGNKHHHAVKPECCKEGAECCVEGAECCKPVCDKPSCEEKAECGEKPACKEKAECGEKPECGKGHCDKPADQQCPKCKKAAAK